MKKPLIYALAVILGSVLIYTVLRFSIHEPPVAEINKAREQLAEAELVYASIYAPKLFQQASLYYDSAMLSWKRENERFILFRKYQTVSINAEKSSKLALEAVAKTRDKVGNEEELLGLRISILEKKLKDFDHKYHNFPFKIKDRNELSRSKLLLNEGSLAYKQKNYLSSKVKLDSAEALITELHNNYEQKLTDYFRSFPKWEKWVEQSISESKKHKNYCIIIDKYARSCALYKNGKMIHTLDIELGKNWMGDKLQQGDKSTPEGIYRVVRKKSNGETKYYKALLLDYPTEVDKKRFFQNKKNRVIKQNAHIGNLIEIHGNGGKGIDWTDGCIALDDNDMDILFANCTTGTNVTIVGSVKPLNKLAQRKK